MKAWKIQIAGNWSEDCKIIFAKNVQEAVRVFKNGEIAAWDRKLDIEEWDVECGSVIRPHGYDYTDASIERGDFDGGENIQDLGPEDEAA